MNLYVGTNTFALLEFLCIRNEVAEPDAEWKMSIDTVYSKDDGFASFYKIAIRCVAEGIVSDYVDLHSIQKYEWNTIVCASYFKEELVAIIRNTEFKKLVFVSEGMSDFTKNEHTLKYPDIFEGRIKYLFNTKGVSNREKFSEIRKIKMTKEAMSTLKKVMPDSFQQLKEIGHYDAIVFTSPIDTDFDYPMYRRKLIHFLEEFCKGKTLLIKRHPRDFNDYDSQKYKTVYAPQSLCGELIAADSSKPRVFAAASSILLNTPLNDSVYVMVWPGVDQMCEHTALAEELLRSVNTIEMR